MNRKRKTHLFMMQRIADEARREIEIRERFGQLRSERVDDLYHQAEKAERILKAK